MAIQVCNSEGPCTLSRGATYLVFVGICQKSSQNRFGQKNCNWCGRILRESRFLGVGWDHNIQSLHRNIYKGKSLEIFSKINWPKHM